MNRLALRKKNQSPVKQYESAGGRPIGSARDANDISNGKITDPQVLQAINQQLRLRGVAETAALAEGKPATVRNLTISIANAAAGAEQNAALFNPNSIVTGLSSGGDITISTSNGAAYADFLKTLASCPLLIAGFQYRASSATQLTRAFTEYKGNIQGSQQQFPINQAITQASKPSDFQDNLLDIAYVTWIDQFTAWVLNCERNATQTLTLNIVYQHGVDNFYGSF